MTKLDVALTIRLRVDLGHGLDLSKVDVAEMLGTLGERVAAQMDGLEFEVAYDRPNDRNAYAGARTEGATTTSIALDTYDDVLAALRAAGFRHVSMVGSGGIDVICVSLTDPADDGPLLLIGEHADMLDLPPRGELYGWRIVFRPSLDLDEVTIYAGSTDVPAMVEHAAEFARRTGFLPVDPIEDQDPDAEAPFSRDRVLAVERMLLQADAPEHKTPEQQAARDALLHAWCMLSGQDEQAVAASLTGTSPTS